MRAWPSRRPTGDEGAIAILVLCYVVIAASLILVVTAATSVHLERKRLLAVADAAALDAADEVSPDSYLRTGIGGSDVVPLTDDSVQNSVRGYLHATPTGLHDLQVVAPTGAPGGRTAEVTLQATAHPALVSWVLSGWQAGITMTVTSRADAPLT